MEVQVEKFQNVMYAQKFNSIYVFMVKWKYFMAYGQMEIFLDDLCLLDFMYQFI